MVDLYLHIISYYCVDQYPVKARNKFRHQITWIFGGQMRHNILKQFSMISQCKKQGLSQTQCSERSAGDLRPSDASLAGRGSGERCSQHLANALPLS